MPWYNKPLEYTYDTAKAYRGSFDDAKARGEFELSDRAESAIGCAFAAYEDALEGFRNEAHRLARMIDETAGDGFLNSLYTYKDKAAYAQDSVNRLHNELAWFKNRFSMARHLARKNCSCKCGHRFTDQHTGECERCSACEIGMALA